MLCHPSHRFDHRNNMTQCFSNGDHFFLLCLIACLSNYRVFTFIQLDPWWWPTYTEKNGSLGPVFSKLKVNLNCCIQFMLKLHKDLHRLALRFLLHWLNFLSRYFLYFDIYLPKCQMSSGPPDLFLCTCFHNYNSILGPCLKVALSKCLGYAIIAGSLLGTFLCIHTWWRIDFWFVHLVIISHIQHKSWSVTPNVNIFGSFLYLYTLLYFEKSIQLANLARASVGVTDLNTPYN